MKAIPSTGNRYAADESGCIYSLVSGAPRKLKCSPWTDGYMRVSIYWSISTAHSYVTVNSAGRG